MFFVVPRLFLCLVFGVHGHTGNSVSAIRGVFLCTGLQVYTF